MLERSYFPLSLIFKYPFKSKTDLLKRIIRLSWDPKSVHHPSFFRWFFPLSWRLSEASDFFLSLRFTSQNYLLFVIFYLSLYYFKYPI